MGSQGLPFPTSNNAPLPIPGGYGGNYSGLNFGSTTGQPFPTLPQYGGYGIPGGGGQYAMPASGGPAYNVGAYGTGAGLAGLNAGILPGYSGSGKGAYDMFGKIYGKGVGATLGDLLSGQLFNPQVAAAFLNAQAPGIARGEAGILGAFGDAGARFSSASALGLGDFESQVQLNQQQTLASMYENAQQQELSLLQSILPNVQQERANQGGWLNTALGIAETVGGAALLPFSGGMSAGLIAGGLGTLARGHGSPQGMQVPLPGTPSIMGNPYMPGYGGNTGTFGMAAPSYNPSTGGIVDPQMQPTGNMFMPISQTMQTSGGSLFDPSAALGATDLTNPNMDWLSFLSQ